MTDLNMLTIKVLLFDTNDVSIEELLTSSFLSDKDRFELNKYKSEETKKEKTCSCIFKNKYVGEYSINEFGKPISKHTNFNISHSKGVVVFVEDSLPIGIDIEKIRPIEEGMIEYISSKEEKEYIKNDIDFFEIWTNKESLIKCIGTGIKNNLKDIPGLAINGIKEYKDKTYYCMSIKYKDYVISITRESNKPFDIEFDENIYII